MKTCTDCVKTEDQYEKEIQRLKEINTELLAGLKDAEDRLSCHYQWLYDDKFRLMFHNIVLTKNENQIMDDSKVTRDELRSIIKKAEVWS